MKTSKLLISFSLLLLIVQSANATYFKEKKESFYFKSDKQEIEILVKKLYEWVETKNSNNDFNPLANKKGDKYIGLDLNAHKKRLEELNKTNFFSQQFLDNYNKIALQIDSNLKTKKIEWFEGELPPFGNDTNPWCNCQDNPENYWKTMTINHMKIENNNASFDWTWSWKGDFKYKVKTVKENGIWKIAFLEGFDFNDFTKI
nr:hypothetical protein [uncultured Flavobacterium sp.]